MRMFIETSNFKADPLVFILRVGTWLDWNRHVQDLDQIAVDTSAISIRATHIKLFSKISGY
jgi:hypothetical protein